MSLIRFLNKTPQELRETSSNDMLGEFESKIKDRNLNLPSTININYKKPVVLGITLGVILTYISK